MKLGTLFFRVFYTLGTAPQMVAYWFLSRAAWLPTELRGV